MSLSPGAKAALAVWGGAILWDCVCPPGQTISEAVERGLNDKRTEVVVSLAIFATAAHLLRAFDDRHDIYAVGFRLMGRMLKRNT